MTKFNLKAWLSELVKNAEEIDSRIPSSNKEYAKKQIKLYNKIASRGRIT